eukprot:TRINITY_DN8601_c0_g1_i1.p2 TRINITY_DN8601_c0_g1~~TRINITY_DN8601_c0_g1_i1.p2  ORF type:complete len:52 (-),score=5.79 TRINITY_DN8601_c0_g1_i1:310-465(-)
MPPASRPAILIPPSQPEAMPLCSGGTTSGTRAEYGAIIRLLPTEKTVNATL